MAFSEKSKHWLKTQFGAGVCFDEPMHRHTYYHIGGPADAMVRPDTTASLIALIKWCFNSGIPYRVMGNGSNVLVKDGGIRGVVIDLGACANHITVCDSAGKEVRVNAGAGVKLQRLCRYALDRGLGGMNFALGIPGTVGGALRMNAGTVSGSMADVVKAVRFLHFSGESITLTGDQLVFGYRKMAVKDDSSSMGENSVILECTIALYPGDGAALKIEAESLLEKRRATQPGEEKSAGCFFKNPASGPAAGRLIDEAGLKGHCVGGAQVSLCHANFIVNKADATAADVIGLMRHIQQCVWEKFNINLEPEVEVIGDETI